MSEYFVAMQPADPIEKPFLILLDLCDMKVNVYDWHVNISWLANRQISEGKENDSRDLLGQLFHDFFSFLHNSVLTMERSPPTRCSQIHLPGEVDASLSDSTFIIY